MLLLIIRGASDWSEAFAVLWYGLFALGFFLGLVAVGARSSAVDRADAGC